jgi:hypothetical protein
MDKFELKTFFDLGNETDYCDSAVEVDEKIARAAMCWSSSFPECKYVDRMTAKQARAMMNVARRDDIRPCKVDFSEAGIKDQDEFMRQIAGITI